LKQHSVQCAEPELISQYMDHHVTSPQKRQSPTSSSSLLDQKNKNPQKAW